MEPKEFKYANKNLLKPQDMTDEECGSLPVYTDGEVCISLWKMTLRERFSALFFGRVWVFIHSGYTQPPISLMTMREIFSETKNDQSPH